MDTPPDIEPCLLVAHDGGEYSLNLDIGRVPRDALMVFDEVGLEAGGYAWVGVADSLLRSFAPEFADAMDYDPEASMFTAFGTNRAALIRLGELLREAIRSPTTLRAAIEAADPNLLED
jgi:hypothetical protein